MADSFDQFPPFKRAMIADFTFQPERFEVWQDQEMIDSGEISSAIKADVRSEQDQGAADILIETEPAQSMSHICRKSIYDICITAGDRIQLLTIPEKENQKECVGLSMTRANIGPTRKAKEFNHDEPFCCNLFLINKNVSKITFSINHPEKLVEFYS